MTHLVATLLLALAALAVLAPAAPRTGCCCGGGTTGPCCPGVNIPDTIHVQITGVGGVSAIAGTYAMPNTGPPPLYGPWVGGNAPTFSVVLQCSGTNNWLVRIECPTGTLVSFQQPPDSVSCSPFHLIYNSLNAGACSAVPVKLDIVP